MLNNSKNDQTFLCELREGLEYASSLAGCVFNVQGEAVEPVLCESLITILEKLNKLLETQTFCIPKIFDHEDSKSFVCNVSMDHMERVCRKMLNSNHSNHIQRAQESNVKIPQDEGTCWKTNVLVAEQHELHSMQRSLFKIDSISTSSDGILLGIKDNNNNNTNDTEEIDIGNDNDDEDDDDDDDNDDVDDVDDAEEGNVMNETEKHKIKPKTASTGDLESNKNNRSSISRATQILKDSLLADSIMLSQYITRDLLGLKNRDVQILQVAQHSTDTVGDISASKRLRLDPGQNSLSKTVLELISNRLFEAKRLFCLGLPLSILITIQLRSLCRTKTDVKQQVLGAFNAGLFTISKCLTQLGLGLLADDVTSCEIRILAMKSLSVLTSLGLVNPRLFVLGLRRPGIGGDAPTRGQQLNAYVAKKAKFTAKIKKPPGFRDSTGLQQQQQQHNHNKYYNMPSPPSSSPPPPPLLPPLGTITSMGSDDDNQRNLKIDYINNSTFKPMTHLEDYGMTNITDKFINYTTKEHSSVLNHGENQYSFILKQTCQTCQLTFAKLLAHHQSLPINMQLPNNNNNNKDHMINNHYFYKKCQEIQLETCPSCNSSSSITSSIAVMPDDNVKHSAWETSSTVCLFPSRNKQNHISCINVIQRDWILRSITPRLIDLVQQSTTAHYYYHPTSSTPISTTITKDNTEEKTPTAEPQPVLWDLPQHGWLLRRLDDQDDVDIRLQALQLIMAAFNVLDERTAEIRYIAHLPLLAATLDKSVAVQLTALEATMRMAEMAPLKDGAVKKLSRLLYRKTPELRATLLVQFFPHCKYSDINAIKVLVKNLAGAVHLTTESIRPFILKNTLEIVCKKVDCLETEAGKKTNFSDVLTIHSSALAETYDKLNSDKLLLMAIIRCCFCIGCYHPRFFQPLLSIFNAHNFANNNEQQECSTASQIYQPNSITPKSSMLVPITTNVERNNRNLQKKEGYNFASSIISPKDLETLYLIVFFFGCGLRSNETSSFSYKGWLGTTTHTDTLTVLHLTTPSWLSS